MAAPTPRSCIARLGPAPCAAWFALLSVAGCALPHEPLEGVTPRDARVVDARGADGSVTRDAGPRDGALDVVVTPPPPPDVLPPPPLDVVVTPPPPPDVVVVDVVTPPPPPDVVTPPPPDVVTPPPADAGSCGAAGQRCCPERRCGDNLACVDWGGGSFLCAPCGRPGDACCGGDRCGMGATCRGFYGGSLRSCAVNSARGDDRDGAPCTLVLGNCGASDLVCVGDRRSAPYSYAHCLRCGGRGEPCCVSGERCRGGLRCEEQPNDVRVCR